MPEWTPNPGPQSEFLSTRAFEVLYGGQAGGGKSEALTVAPLRFVEHPRFAALTLRRTLRELKRTIIKRSREIYPSGGGVYHETDYLWRFPSGAEVSFGYLDGDKDVEQYQGAEVQFLAFDELTHFSESEYRYLLSRVRGPPEIPKMIRCTSNPGGPGHEWVQRRWAPWLAGDDYQGPRAQPGELLWFKAHEHDDGEDLVERGTPMAFSRTFIPAAIKDNPKGDPDYWSRLSLLDAVTRAQLRDGNWLIRPAAGLYFKRAWWKFLPEPPADVRWVRRWDLAATEDSGDNDPDWTVGVKIGLTPDRDGEGNPIPVRIIVADVQRVRATPHEVDQLMENTAEADGTDCVVWIPEDPGSSGKRDVANVKQRLRRFEVRSERETGDKVKRAGPWSAQVEAGNVYLIRAPWNEAFMQEHEAFPSKGVHDDQVDAAAGGYRHLSEPAFYFA